MKNMHNYVMFNCTMLKLLGMESYWAVNLNKLEAALEEKEEGTPIGSRHLIGHITDDHLDFFEYYLGCLLSLAERI